MQWYYAEQGRQVGPLDEAALDNLVAAGIVRDDTLVWREGMGSWTSHASMRGPRNAGHSPVAAPAAPVAVMTQVCGECGKPFWLGDLVPIGPAYICAACKPIFLQRLREGGGQALGALHYAGFWIRLVARVIDGVLLTIVRFAVLLPLGLTSSVFPTAGTPTQNLAGPLRVAAFSSLLALVINLAYEAYFVSARGATIGKMVLGLKVVRADGTKVSTGLAVGRYFGMLVSDFTLLIGYVVAAFDSEKRALHDRMCDTRVVYANERITQLSLNKSALSKPTFAQPQS
jgi:uncharacterized RDD family membrane protein YckC